MEVIWHGSIGLNEQPSSPEWDYSELVTATTVHRGPFSLCQSSAPRRGYLGTGVFTGLRVDHASVKKERGGIGLLTVVYKGAPEDDTNVPPDECEVEVSQAEFAIERHPLFADLLDEQLDAVVAWIRATNEEQRAEYQRMIDTNSDAALLLEKLKRQQTHFVLWPPVYVWTSHFLTIPDATVGGFLETPSGPIPAPPGYTWLRCADKLRYTGSYWQLTRKWMGAEEWDEDIYGAPV